VLQLRELDLQLAFEAASALREYVEDEPAAVEHAAAEFLLEVALLTRGERVVHDDEVGPDLDDPRTKLLDLARPEEESRLGHLAGDRDDIEDLRAGGPGQCRELRDAVRLGCPTQPDAHEDCAFSATRPVEQVTLTPPVGRPAQSAGGGSAGTSSSPIGRRTLRAGTTVEIACL
jgi:hypothetical protein